VSLIGIINDVLIAGSALSEWDNMIYLLKNTSIY